MKLKFLFIAIVVFSTVLGSLVLGAGVSDPVLAVTIIRASPTGTTSQAPGVDLTIQQLFGIIVGIACYLIRISIVLITIAILYFGFKFLISQGDPGKLKEAREALTWGVVGIIIIFGTYTIIRTVNNAVGGNDGNINLLNCSGK